MDVFCNLKILHRNVHGLYSIISNIEISLSKQSDILTLSETHTFTHHSEVNFRIRRFNLISRKKERNGSRWGVALYIFEKINFNRREDLEPENIACGLWL